jgi:stearoyl-CoA desaturase (delta-9 desaturase)
MQFMAIQAEAFDGSSSTKVDWPPRSRPGGRAPTARHGLDSHERCKTHRHDLAQGHATRDESIADEENVWARGLDWPTVLWISFAHIGAFGALFFFTWKAVALFAVLFWITGSLGVCMGYHRLLTHGSFTTYKPVRWLFALVGSLSGEGSAITWVATHRKHHAHSDQEGDPHSPHDGGLWAHFLWLMPNHGAKHHTELAARYAPDLVKDPMLRFLHSTFLVWHWLLAAVLFFVGWFFWDAYTGWSFIFWGVFFRMVYLLHITRFVKTATHIWGYRK